MNKLYIDVNNETIGVLGVTFVLTDEQITKLDTKLKLVSGRHLFTEPDSETYKISDTINNDDTDIIKIFIDEYAIYDFILLGLTEDTDYKSWSMELYDMDFDIFDEQAVLNNFDGNKELLKYNIL